MFYRPVWTSGRYDSKTHSAIFYNLLSGISYFFEDVSADVISYVLKAGRNGVVDMVGLCRELDLDVNDLTEFFSQLNQIGLISTEILNKSTVEAERRRMVANRQSIRQYKTDATDTLFDRGGRDAEQDYLNRTKSEVFSLLIEVTYNCSEKCIHCYNPGAVRNNQEVSKRNDRVELNLEEYKRIIDDFYDHGLVRVCLSGGDPFSKPIIWDIIQYLYLKDIVFDVYTNGQLLLGKEKKLSAFFPCSVGLSIYSAIPEVHDAITGIYGSLDKTLAVLNNVALLSIPLAIKCCVMRPNCKSYRGVIEIADRYASTLQLECNVFDSVDGDACVSTLLRLSREELRIVLRDKNTPLYVGPELKDFGARSIPMNQNTCSAGYSGFCLTPEGILTLCASFPSAVGSLRTDNLSTILLDSSLLWWKRQKMDAYENCGRFDYCVFCALCPGLNFSKNGTPLKPCDNNCFVAQVRKEVADLLREGNDPLNGKSIEEALALLPDTAPYRLHKIQMENFYSNKLSETIS